RILSRMFPCQCFLLFCVRVQDNAPLGSYRNILVHPQSSDKVQMKSFDFARLPNCQSVRLSSLVLLRPDLKVKTKDKMNKQKFYTFSIAKNSAYKFRYFLYIGFIN